MEEKEKLDLFQPVPVERLALEALTRAEIDIQISTAKQYPRSMDQFLKRGLAMVSLDEETAASCIYKRPVGRDEQGEGQKIVEGESVRLAEIVAACYGNIRVGATVIEQTPRFVRARGMAHDLETNNAASSEVVEATVSRKGQPYSERQRAVVAKAALSKARRDAVFMVVPKALCRPIREQARKVAIGDAATLAHRRDRVMSWVATLGIDQGRVFAALSVQGVADIGLDQLELLTGLRTSIRDGDVSVDEAFPPIGSGTPSTAQTGEVADRGDQVAKALNGQAKQPPPQQQAPAMAPAGGSVFGE